MSVCASACVLVREGTELMARLFDEFNLHYIPYKYHSCCHPHNPGVPFHSHYSHNPRGARVVFVELVSLAALAELVALVAFAELVSLAALVELAALVALVELAALVALATLITLITKKLLQRK
jgi:hypothetical protein